MQKHLGECSEVRRKTRIMRNEFSDIEKAAYVNAVQKLFDNIQIAKARCLSKAVTSLGYTTDEIARDVNNRFGRFELKTINHEVSNLNQYVLYDKLKHRAFIIMQGIEGADFDHGYTIEQNKEVPFNYYR